MIHYFATRAHYHLIREFLDAWSPADNARIRGVPYEEFPFWRPLPNSACIFADLERLRPRELPLAAQLADALRALPQNFTILNDPRRYAGRFNLLKILHQHGINDFNARRLDDLAGDLRFPVFLRNELNHDGPMTSLLQSRDDLNRALAQKIFRKSPQQKHLMLVEYCDTAGRDGLFRKYSAMKIGDRLIPRHILFGADWSTKKTESVTEKTIAEETEFLETFPHAAQIEEVFRLAGLDYGRIDYGVRQGRIQVWEINTNPGIMSRPDHTDPRRMAIQSRCAQQVLEAFRLFSDLHPAGAGAPFRTRKFFFARLAQIFQGRRPRR